MNIKLNTNSGIKKEKQMSTIEQHLFVNCYNLQHKDNKVFKTWINCLKEGNSIKEQNSHTHLKNPLGLKLRCSSAPNWVTWLQKWASAVYNARPLISSCHVGIQAHNYCIQVMRDQWGRTEVVVLCCDCGATTSSSSHR